MATIGFISQAINSNEWVAFSNQCVANTQGIYGGGIWIAVNPYAKSISEWSDMENQIWSYTKTYQAFENQYKFVELCRFCIEKQNNTISKLHRRQEECQTCGTDVWKGKNRIYRYYNIEEEKYWIDSKVWSIYSILEIFHKNITTRIKLDKIAKDSVDRVK